MTSPIGPSYGLDTINQPGRMVTNPKGTLDNNAFMKLLVTQLRYQDPTAPTDTNALMQQTSMLSQVEMMRDMTSAANLSTASALIGRKVTYIDSGTGTEMQGTVEQAGKVNGKTTLKVSGKDADLTSVTWIS